MATQKLIPTAAARALQQAHAELAASGEPVTARALRERAKVSMNTVTAWLKAKRAAERGPSPVPEDLTAQMTEVLRESIVEPIWLRCLEQAQAETADHQAAVAQQHADEVLAMADSLNSAQETLKVAEGRASAAEKDAAGLRERLAAAEAALADLRAMRDVWVTEAKTARRAAREAQALADKRTVELAAAQGEIAGLRAAAHHSDE